MKRIIVCILCALCLAGCGKRGKLEFPEGSVYPRQYPASRRPKPERIKLEEPEIADETDELTDDDVPEETGEDE